MEGEWARPALGAEEGEGAGPETPCPPRLICSRVLTRQEEPCLLNEWRMRAVGEGEREKDGADRWGAVGEREMAGVDRGCWQVLVGERGREGAESSLWCRYCWWCCILTTFFRDTNRRWSLTSTSLPYFCRVEFFPIEVALTCWLASDSVCCREDWPWATGEGVGGR